jgi:hypothetical protein
MLMNMLLSFYYTVLRFDDLAAVDVRLDDIVVPAAVTSYTSGGLEFYGESEITSPQT